MTRRTLGLLIILGLRLLVESFAADAQRPTNVLRIDMVSGGGDPRVWTIEIDSMLPGGFARAFRQGLGDLGYIEGENIMIEYRTAEGYLEGIPGLVAKLVQLEVDGQTFSLPPQATSTHQQCRPTEVTFRWPGTQERQTMQPGHGARYTIVQEDAGEFRVEPG